MLNAIETLVIRPHEKRDEQGRLTYFGYVVEDPKTGRIILQNGRHQHAEMKEKESEEGETERLKRHLLKETIKSLPKPTGKVVLVGIPVKYLL